MSLASCQQRYSARAIVYSAGATDAPWQVLGRYSLARWQLASDIKSEGATVLVLKHPNTSQPASHCTKVIRYFLGRYSLARWQVQLASDIKSEGATVLGTVHCTLYS